MTISAAYQKVEVQEEKKVSDQTVLAGEKHICLASLHRQQKKNENHESNLKINIQMIYDAYISLPQLRKNFDFVNKPFSHDTKRHGHALKQH